MSVDAHPRAERKRARIGAAIRSALHEQLPDKPRDDQRSHEASDDPSNFGECAHGVCSGLTTQAQRPGPRDAMIATVTRWPGSLQRMVRRRDLSVSHKEINEWWHAYNQD